MSYMYGGPTYGPNTPQDTIYTGMFLIIIIIFITIGCMTIYMFVYDDERINNRKIENVAIKIGDIIMFEEVEPLEDLQPYVNILCRMKGFKHSYTTETEIRVEFEEAVEFPTTITDHFKVIVSKQRNTKYILVRLK